MVETKPTADSKATVAYIGLGSNLQDPEKQLHGALSEIEALPDSRLLMVSSFYRSLPMGPRDQPDYINAVAQIETCLIPLSLLSCLQAIEDRHGRIRGSVRWGARTLDLDMLLYGESIINDAILKVPHPGIAERPFVLYPLTEIAPGITIPGIGPLPELLQRCPPAGLDRLA